jgi:transmembrane sensor
MKEPGREMDKLFARLGEAQDRALAATPPARLATARAVPPVRSLRRPVAVALASLTVAAAVAVVVLGARKARSPEAQAVATGSAAVGTTVGRAGTAATSAATPTLTATGLGRPVPMRTMLSAADSELPLQFSNGSIATFRRGSTGRLLGLDEAGAEIELVAGGVDASIFHGVGARWVFRAGPFAIRVTGTRFEVAWSPVTRRLVVSLRQGGVTVDGAVLGAGVPLRAGQRLAVTLGPDNSTGSVQTEALPETESAPGARVAAGNRGVGGEAREGDGDNDWMALADRGAQAEAWRAARRLGIDQLSRRLEPARLLSLADVARYAGARSDARALFLALVTRFPRHRLASDAVFSLGRLAFEAGDPAAATSWFARYQTQWPAGALASEATGRLIEAALARHDDTAARAAAQSYLDRAPAGPYATLARQLLTAPPRSGATTPAARGAAVRAPGPASGQW